MPMGWQVSSPPAPGSADLCRSTSWRQQERMQCLTMRSSCCHRSTARLHTGKRNAEATENGVPHFSRRFCEKWDFQSERVERPLPRRNLKYSPGISECVGPDALVRAGERSSPLRRDQTPGHLTSRSTDPPSRSRSCTKAGHSAASAPSGLRRGSRASPRVRPTSATW